MPEPGSKEEYRAVQAELMRAKTYLIRAQTELAKVKTLKVKAETLENHGISNEEIRELEERIARTHTQIDKERAKFGLDELDEDDDEGLESLSAARKPASRLVKRHKPREG